MYVYSKHRSCLQCTSTYVIVSLSVCLTVRQSQSKSVSQTERQKVRLTDTTIALP